jgi:hypothetical protein
VITPDCQRFCVRLAAHLTYGLRVVQAWTVAETGGGTSGVRGFNFVNVGNTDSNPFGGPRWTSPEEAADATYQWLRDNPASGAPILAASGGGDQEQLRALWTSPFSSSHYGPPDSPGAWLRADYAALPPAPTQTGGITVMPDISPPAAIVSLCAFTHPTIGPCAAAVAADGAVFCDPATAYLGGANGKQFFLGRSAAKIDASPGGYTITDTVGETYAFPTTAA